MLTYKAFSNNQNEIFSIQKLVTIAMLEKELDVF